MASWLNLAHFIENKKNDDRNGQEHHNQGVRDKKLWFKQ